MTTNQRPPSPPPFTSDADFLHDAYIWIGARVARLAEEHRITPDWSGPSFRKALCITRAECEEDPTGAGRLPGLLEREQRLHLALEARLFAHRESGEQPLGLDKLCRHYDLCQDEWTTLLSISAAAVSPRLHERTFSELGRYYGSLCVIDLLDFLDPADLGQQIQTRRYFLQGASLLRHSLVAVEDMGEKSTPDEFLLARVRLREHSFQVISGLVNPDDEEPGE